MSLTDTIQQEIQNTVPQMIQDVVTAQTHNGSDSPNIQGQYLAGAPQPNIALISVPASGTADPQVRATVNQIITQLQALGLFN